jgi:hypothetical protein
MQELSSNTNSIALTMIHPSTIITPITSATKSAAADAVQIFAMLPSGHTVRFSARPSDKVEDVATVVRDRAGIPRRCQQLVAGKSVLHAGRTLGEYGVPRETCVIYVRTKASPARTPRPVK